MIAAALAAAALAVVVTLNQPHDGPAALPVRAAASTPRPLPVVTEAPPTSGLALVHHRVVLRDTTAGRSGAPGIRGGSGILIDADSQTVLWQQGMHDSRAPASTTKVLTSLVALENFSPDRLVTITPDALTQAGDETVMGLKAGEQLSVAELLHGMLLVSGNDAATAMAVDTVGLQRFVAAMNEQVAALGLRDSHFVTPVGLDDPGNRASPYDLAAIALTDVERFPLFNQVVAEQHAVLPGSALHHTYDLWNLNQLLQRYPAADGIKPGWTGDAGPCLVGMAERDGHRLITVLMNDHGLYTDAAHLLDWGFTQEGLPPLLPPTPTPKPPPATPTPRRP